MPDTDLDNVFNVFQSYFIKKCGLEEVTRTEYIEVCKRKFGLSAVKIRRCIDYLIWNGKLKERIEHKTKWISLSDKSYEEFCAVLPPEGFAGFRPGSRESLEHSYYELFRSFKSKKYADDFKKTGFFKRLAYACGNSLDGDSYVPGKHYTCYTDADLQRHILDVFDFCAAKTLARSEFVKACVSKLDIDVDKVENIIDILLDKKCLEVVDKLWLRKI